MVLLRLILLDLQAVETQTRTSERESEVLMPPTNERQETKVPSDPIDYGYGDATQEELEQLDRDTWSTYHSDMEYVKGERHLSLEEVHNLLHGYRDSRATREGYYE